MKDPKFRLLMVEDIIEAVLRGGSSLELARYLLFIICTYYKEDYLEEALDDLILEIQSRVISSKDSKEHTRIQGSIQDIISFRGTGTFSISDIYSDAKATTPGEKSACRTVINRMCMRGMIEKVSGGRSGLYRSVTVGAPETKFLTAPKGEYPIKLPLELHTMCKLFPGNLVVIAGSKSSGKTAFALNTALMNQSSSRVVYINSEMGDEEWTERLTKLGFTREDQIKFKCYKKSSDYQDLVSGDDAIYIIDFLEIHDEFYKIGKTLKAIHDKLKDGIAIVLIQMKSGGNTGRGGDFSKEVSRLYLAMDYDASMKCTRVSIEDMKSPKTPAGFKGWSRYIKIIEGSKLSPMGNWTDATITFRQTATR